MRTFLHRPHAIPARRVLFQVHLWIGVLAGAYVFIVCATGAALVFRIEMQRAEHPHLFTPGEGPPADPAAILEHLRNRYPNARISGIDAPTTARPTTLAYLVEGDRVLTLLLDPASGRVLGELPEGGIVRTLQELHFNLLAGRRGRVVNGIGALLLLALCATGVVIWWPGAAHWRRGVTVDVGRNWRRMNRELHSAVGIWTVLVVSMWAITGLYFAFPAQFRAAVNAVSPLTTARAPQSHPPAAEATPVSWGELIARAREHAPGWHVQRVVLPGHERAAFLVMFSRVSPAPVGRAELISVYLDQYSGAVLTTPGTRQTLGDVVMDWVGALHVGSFGGAPVRLAWLLLGLAPPLLVVTGLLMWWSRVLRHHVTDRRPA